MKDRWTDDGRMDTHNVTLAHSNHKGKWCSKFG